MNLDLLITGCGRSGTQYITEVLSSAGVACSHENRFTVFGPQDVPGPKFEASWYAAPFLSCVHPKTRIIHLVREPTAVVKSFHRIGLCAPTNYHHIAFGRPLPLMIARAILSPSRMCDRVRYVRAHRGLLDYATTCLDPEHEVDRLWQYWDQWNGLVENFLASAPNPRLRLRLEDLDAHLPALAVFLNIEEPMHPLSIANTKPLYQKRPIFWTQMPVSVRARAERYGYSCNA